MHAEEKAEMKKVQTEFNICTQHSIRVGNQQLAVWPLRAWPMARDNSARLNANCQSLIANC
jgi:hypothetical protein